MSGEMLSEQGILYTFDAESKFPSFTYTWEHIPTGKNGTRVVYCQCRRDFLALLYIWNNEEWKFRVQS